MGELDAGGPTPKMKGSKEEIIEAIAQVSERCGLPLDRAAVERIADQAIRKCNRRRIWRILRWPLGVAIVVLFAVLVIGISKSTA